jgi:hypothetical protein
MHSISLFQKRLELGFEFRHPPLRVAGFGWMEGINDAYVFYLCALCADRKSRAVMMLYLSALGWLLARCQQPPMAAPISNAFLHSSGNTVSWHSCFAYGSNKIHGQSVLL